MRGRSAFQTRSAVPGSPGSGVRVTVDELVLLRADAARIAARAPDAVAGLFPGLYRALSRGRGLEFEEVRHYQPGDDYRVIDWRVTARTGRLHTKVFREERERTVLLGLDAGSSLRFGSRRAFLWVAAAQALGLIAWLAADNHDRVGGIVLGTADGIRESRPLLGSTGAMRLFRLWAEAGGRPALPPGVGLVAGLERLRRHASHGALIVLASDFRGWHGGAERHAAQLARRNDLVLMQVYDPLERTLPQAGWLGFSDGTEAMTLDTGDGALQARLRDEFETRAERVRAFCVARGARFLQLDSHPAAPEGLRRAVMRDLMGLKVNGP